MMLVREPKER